MLTGKPLTIVTLLRTFSLPISLTWVLTLFETALMALVPLFIGFAIDGLLRGDPTALMQLAALLAGMVVVGVLRRIYDTRIYGAIRVEFGREMIDRSKSIPVSSQNARLGMARELVDFLEMEAPELMNAVVQLIMSVIILYSFHAVLSYASIAAAIAMVVVYGLFHRRFFRLNGDLNHQTERQVSILETKSSRGLLTHLKKLRRIEVRLSDTEAYVYGAIFMVLMGFIIFNLWFATTTITVTVGTIFSIVAYSWEFVEAALMLPITLQRWSRLSEIMSRINQPAS